MTRPLIAAATLAAAALLAACGPANAPTDAGLTNTAGAVTNTGTDYVARIRSMPEGQRTAVFLRAIRDAGQTCQTVTEATEVSNPNGPATWSARCDDGGQWVVSIGDDGVATVTNRAAIPAAG